MVIHFPTDIHSLTLTRIHLTPLALLAPTGPLAMLPTLLDTPDTPDTLVSMDRLGPMRP